MGFMNTEPGSEPAERLGLRERKKMATRQEIGTAAMRLAMERGLDNVTVEDIAAAANVSPRTFNNYFASKLEAIAAPGVDRAVRIGATLCERPASEPLWDAITAAVLEHYDAVQSPRGTWREGMRRVLLSPPMRGEYLKTNAAMQQALAAAIAERTGLDVDWDMLPVVLAGAVTTASQRAVRRWFEADPPAELRALVAGALGELASAFTDVARWIQPAGPPGQRG
jgi:AcrR family transcriptional regulator